jgi:RNA polymerase-binding protein DksA
MERNSDMQKQIDIEDMRNRLQNRKKIMDEQLEIESGKVLPAGMSGKDRADLAYDYEYRAHRVALLNQLESQIEEINEALKRIESGDYGICSNCGAAITPERLEALPHADMCIRCQRKEV